jgi:hypothetical protein
MVLSVGGWLGALAGCVVGAVAYGFMLPFLMAQFGQPAGPMRLEEREALEARFSVMRRAVLAVVIGACGVFGYWLGQHLGG